jgi:SagB-type dehydrogenase family enzyme
MKSSLKQVFEYHEATKHQFQRYARGPGYLDWATQPDPFRRFEGSPMITLEKVLPDEGILYDQVMDGAPLAVQPLSCFTLSNLFLHSLALSAWKRAGSEKWALRVNPSSGNLHPTEGYLICGPVQGVHTAPAVFHYAPREHALELRTVLSDKAWETLTAGMPPNSLFLALSSIHWREAWKYGERAYRYCHLDVGHALGAISVGAAGLGWRAVLMDDLGTDQIAALSGLADSEGVESEHADCLLAILPGHVTPSLTPPNTITAADLTSLVPSGWLGQPNQLSRSHAHWRIIDDVSAACRKPTTIGDKEPVQGQPSTQQEHQVRPLVLKTVVRQRRSAVSMDGVSTLEKASFFRILQRLMPSDRCPPFSALPWSPKVHPVFFVHRVLGLTPGLYILCRDQREEPALRGSMDNRFLWLKPEDCPGNLPFYQLLEGDLRKEAIQISCFQDIAGEGCFGVGMIARFQEVLQQTGAWFYPRLYWESGMIGQVLYLEAEAVGLRGTGIGCFFDDAFHTLLGLEGKAYQDLYHFTVGGPVEDRRLTTLPAYSE